MLPSFHPVVIAVAPSVKVIVPGGSLGPGKRFLRRRVGARRRGGGERQAEFDSGRRGRRLARGVRRRRSRSIASRNWVL
jgi:hypothetical protein